MCLEFNGRTQGKFAVTVFPCVRNLQNATNQNFSETYQTYQETCRDEVRANKLMDAARKAGAAYRETPNFARAMVRLTLTLFLAKRQQILADNRDNSDAVSVATSVSGGLGPSP